ncbi:MAG: hypothetical protein EBR40_10905 [Proteobacteria bacterium]|nr:hypothetical protein [Pseudomonadota bacterium]
MTSMEQEEQEKDIFYEMAYHPLSQFVKKKNNIKKIMDFLWKDVAKNNAEYARFYLYELLVEWTTHPNMEHIISFLKKKQFGMKHPVFQKYHDMELEQDSFLLHPPEIEEGVIECRKCGSKKTYSFSKQIRRADESATVFVRCALCSASFKM